ncbi:MAG: hypothetical protein A2506_13400 [Elusimicrobia bacterium RIFOXYD12_FULL_66_9]|nr:MAG: hypothetical protein A2506_13400 [Elusimicrobia bacterium RIFOXYD12_FULL_66_9]
MTSSSERPVPQRGRLYLADLGSAHGTESGKIRPVLVLQTDMLNRRHSSTVVLPLTTKVRPESVLMRVHFKKGEAGLASDSDALIDQIRSIDMRRLRRELGAAPPRRMREVERNIALLLDLPEA